MQDFIYTAWLLIAPCLCAAAIVALFVAIGADYSKLFKRKPKFMVYHSDSAKYFKAYDWQDATEWLACAIGDACIIDVKTGETVAIRFSN